MNKRVLAWVAAVALVAVVAGCVPPSGSSGRSSDNCPDDVGTPTPTAVRKISYGPNPAHVADLLPACTESAVGTIMFVPGGGYTELRRSMARSENVQRLRDEGWVVVVIDYRLAPTYQWSAQGADVRRAITWWRTQGAAQWGAPAAPLVGMGWSAGGHLAEWATVREDGPTFDAGISMAGGTYWPDRLDSNGAKALLGPNPSLSRQLDASTVPHLDADDPPLLHLHGPNDSVVSVKQAELLADRILSHGDPTKHRVIIDEACGHNFRCVTAERVDPFLDDLVASFTGP